MKKWNVYATRKILDPAIPIIAKECSVVLNNKARPPTRSELLAGVRNKDAILCTLSDNIDRKVMDAAGSSLKVISSYSTGVDHIDINEATKRSILVTTTGDILTEAVADLTFALILATSRRLAQGYEMITTNGIQDYLQVCLDRHIYSNFQFIIQNNELIISIDIKGAYSPRL